MRPKPEKSQKTSKTYVFAGSIFSLIFWTPFSTVLEPKMVSKDSPAKAFFQKKNETNATLFPCWCFLVLEGASGHDFHRFSSGFGVNSGIFGWIWNCFAMFVGAFL